MVGKYILKQIEEAPRNTDIRPLLPILRQLSGKSHAIVSPPCNAVQQYDDIAKAGLVAAAAALSADNDKQRVILTQEAVKFSKYAMELPVPKSRKQVDIERIIKQPIYSKQPDLKGIKPLIDKITGKSIKAVRDIKNQTLKAEMTKEVFSLVGMMKTNREGEKIKVNQENETVNPKMEEVKTSAMKAAETLQDPERKKQAIELAKKLGQKAQDMDIKAKEKAALLSKDRAQTKAHSQDFDR